jgi:hypothetical protein
MTNRELISEVTGDLRALQVDDRVSQRFILSKLKTINALLLKRENEQLRLYDDNNVWFTIGCLEMQELSPASYPDGCKGANVIGKIYNYTRSINAIPQIYSSKIGPIIREIQTLDDAGIYQPTTPTEYARIVNREFRNPNIRYYWFDGRGRLVIPNSSTKMVSITASFMEPWRAMLIDSCAQPNSTVSTTSSGKECTTGPQVITSSTACPEPLDDPFLCPTHLLSSVKEMATKDLYEFYKRNITDPVPDDDNNSKVDRSKQQSNG